MIRRDQYWMDPAYVEQLRMAGLGSMDAALTRHDGRVCAWSRTTDTVYLPSPQRERPGVFLKRYLYPTWRNRLRGTFRGTFFGRHRAAAEAALLDEMRTLGIPAVRPIACGARRIAHFVASCVLITEEVPGACNLTTFATEVAAGRRKLARDERRTLIRCFADSIATLHDSGFSHGQLYWRNILIQETAIGEYAFYFLDARPRGSRRLAGSAVTCIEELGHLLASAMPFTTSHEQIRFLAHYATQRELRLESDDRRRVQELAARKQAHELQRIKMNERFEAWNAALVAEGRR
ncbi:MAG: lipopolysaccharide kinase InaA family protein [Phycisphaerae bacterium]